MQAETNSAAPLLSGIVQNVQQMIGSKTSEKLRREIARLDQELNRLNGEELDVRQRHGQAVLAVEMDPTEATREELAKVDDEAKTLRQKIGRKQEALDTARANLTAAERQEAVGARRRKLGEHRGRQDKVSASARRVQALGRELAQAIIELDNDVETVRLGFFRLLIKHDDRPTAVHENRLSRENMEGIWAEWIAGQGVPHPLLHATNRELRPNYQSFAGEIDKRLADYDLTE